MAGIEVGGNMYGVAGYTEGGSPVEQSWRAQELADIMQAASRGWNAPITNYLPPQDAMRGQMAGWGQMNEQRQQELRAQIAQAEMAQRQAELQGKYDIASQQTQLGYAKMPHEIEMEKLRRAGLIEAAGVKGQGDWMKTIGLEAGKNRRADQRNTVEQQRIAQGDTRNALLEQGILQKDRPPPWKPTQMQEFDIAKLRDAIMAADKTIKPQDAYWRAYEEYAQRAGGAESGRREAFRSGVPVKQEGTSTASPIVNPYEGVTKTPQQWAEQSWTPNRANLPKYPGRVLDWLLSNPSGG